MTNPTNRNICKVFCWFKILQPVNELMEGPPCLWVSISQPEVPTTDSLVFFQSLTTTFALVQLCWCCCDEKVSPDSSQGQVIVSTDKELKTMVTYSTSPVLHLPTQIPQQWGICNSPWNWKSFLLNSPAEIYSEENFGGYCGFWCFFSTGKSVL